MLHQAQIDREREGGDMIYMHVHHNLCFFQIAHGERAHGERLSRSLTLAEAYYNNQDRVEYRVEYNRPCILFTEILNFMIIIHVRKTRNTRLVIGLIFLHSPPTYFPSIRFFGKQSILLIGYQNFVTISCRVLLYEIAILFSLWDLNAQ